MAYVYCIKETFNLYFVHVWLTNYNVIPCHIIVDSWSGTEGPQSKKASGWYR